MQRISAYGAITNKYDSIFWILDLGSKFLRQDSEMTLPIVSVSDLPFSLKKSWELVCLRTARSLLLTLRRRLSQNPSSHKSRSQFLQWKYINKAQIKHIKNFSIKNFGPPKTPPQNSLCLGFSCILKGKEPPNIKNLRGQGVPFGGGGGV